MVFLTYLVEVGAVPPFLRSIRPACIGSTRDGVGTTPEDTATVVVLSDPQWFHHRCREERSRAVLFWSFRSYLLYVTNPKISYDRNIPTP
jgi:hypothetical protein